MLTELLKESLLDTYLHYLKIDKKKFLLTRFVYAMMLSILFTMAVFYFDKGVFLVALPLVFFVGWKYPYLKLVSTKKEVDLKNSYLFPQFLESFAAILPTAGNVYQALKETIPYTSEPLKLELEKLVDKIKDGHNRDDYLDFAKYVGSSEAYMIMNMIYQFNEQGIEKESLQSLRKYIQDLRENKMDELIKSKMGAAEKIALLPIVIAIIFFFGFFFTVFNYYSSGAFDAAL